MEGLEPAKHRGPGPQIRHLSSSDRSPFLVALAFQEDPQIDPPLSSEKRSRWTPFLGINRVMAAL